MFLVLVAILISLSLVGIDLTVLSVFGGALGVALGFGMQKIASNYVSGFIILLERGMAIGDMVTVDKYYGKVAQINTRYTVLRGLDGVESAVPNEMFVSTPVQNHSLSERAIRLSTQLVIEYHDEFESLLPLLEQAAAGVERVSSVTPPSALLIKFGPDGLELEVGFWITDPENGRLVVLSDVNRAIWRTCKRNKSVSRGRSAICVGSMRVRRPLLKRRPIPICKRICSAEKFRSMIFGAGMLNNNTEPQPVIC